MPYDDTCGVFALAHVAGVPVDRVWQLARDRFGKFTRGMRQMDIFNVARDLGFKDFAPRFDLLYGSSKPSKFVDSNLKTVVERIKSEEPSSTFLIFTRGHVCAWARGELHDVALNYRRKVDGVYEMRMNRMATEKTVASLLSGTYDLRRVARRRETAGRSPVDVHQQVVLDRSGPRDTLLLQQGNVSERYDSMITRRRVAALAMQHRVVQRLDKEIAILRAALGLPRLPPEEIVRTHVTARDPTADNDLEIASEQQWSTSWASGVTANGLQTLRACLGKRGYYYNERKTGDITHHEWTGGADPASIAVATLGDGAWAITVSRDGEARPLYGYRSTGNAVVDGIPGCMSEASWDGDLGAERAQAYAKAWSKLLSSLRAR